MRLKVDKPRFMRFVRGNQWRVQIIGFRSKGFDLPLVVDFYPSWKMAMEKGMIDAKIWLASQAWRYKAEEKKDK
jgi:hypothetical protein